MIMPPKKLRRYQEGGDVQPYVASVTRQERQMDPIIQQLLFGLDGEGGFVPGAMRAAERTFFDEQGRPLVIPQEIAGFSPDQLAAMQLAREQVGAQQPFLRRAEEQFRSGLGAIQRGAGQQLRSQQQALGQLQRGAREEQMQRQRGLQEGLQGIQQQRQLAQQAVGDLRGDIGEQRQFSAQALDQFQSGLGRGLGTLSIKACCMSSKPVNSTTLST